MWNLVPLINGSMCNVRRKFWGLTLGVMVIFFQRNFDIFPHCITQIMRTVVLCTHYPPYKTDDRDLVNCKASTTVLMIWVIQWGKRSKFLWKKIIMTPKIRPQNLLLTIHVDPFVNGNTSKSDRGWRTCFHSKADAEIPLGRWRCRTGGKAEQCFAQHVLWKRRYL